MQTATAPAAESFAIRGVRNETFTIVSIDENDQYPRLKADLIERGFDGKLYTMARVIAGTRKQAQEVICFRGRNEGEFVPMV